jgi:magnesium transporter
MEIFVYRAGSNEVEDGFPVAQLPELLKDENAVIWVDMEAPTRADDDVLLNVFHFHPLTVEDCRANRHHPKVEEFPDYIYFIVHAVRTDASPERFNTIELDGYLGRNFVVTYHHEQFCQRREGEADRAIESGYLPARRRVSVAFDHRQHRR